MPRIQGKIVKIICQGRRISYTVGNGAGGGSLVEGIMLMGATPTKPFHAQVICTGFTLEVYDVAECVYQDYPNEREEE